MLFVGFNPEKAFEEDFVEQDIGVPSVVAPMADLNPTGRRWSKGVHLMRDSEAIISVSRLPCREGMAP